MIEYAQCTKFKCALTLFLVTWALNASPPRLQQLYKMQFDKFGMLPLNSGFLLPVQTG